LSQHWLTSGIITSNSCFTPYYRHSSKKAKRAAVENYAQRLAPEPVRVQGTIQ